MSGAVVDLRPCDVSVVRDLVAAHHGYGAMGATATYAFAVWEHGAAVAAYAWQPPPYGAARAVCPAAPGAVLALSRMVAVPKSGRALKHISKPLRTQMRSGIDRGRWPVLITYSDAGQGHTGYVYQCSGWTPTHTARRATWNNDSGQRRSPYKNGAWNHAGLTRSVATTLTRWEHWACERDGVEEHMARSGWRYVPVEGRVWRSGNQAHTWRKTDAAHTTGERR